MVDGRSAASKTLAKALASPENDIAVSAATFWGILIKHMLGRIDIDLDELLSSITSEEFSELPVQFRHTLKLQSLPRRHDDPFDRILIAQSMTEGRRLVTTDKLILSYAGLPGFDPFSE